MSRRKVQNVENDDGPVYEANSAKDAAVTIVPISNGFIVRGEVQFQTNRPSDGPMEWKVFETFDAMAAYLRERLVRGGRK